MYKIRRRAVDFWKKDSTIEKTDRPAGRKIGGKRSVC